MASNYTSNYGLRQWETTDQVLRTEFNEDNAKVDAALGALEQTVTKQGTQLSTQETVISKLGNCSSYFATYIGNGKTEQVSHTFPHKPVIVIIMDLWTGFLTNGRDIIACQGKTIPIMGDNKLEITWNGNTISWFYDGSTEVLLNSPNHIYQIVALLDMSA